MIKLLTFITGLFLSLSVTGQRTHCQYEIISKTSLESIPFAHILCKNKLVSISNYDGKFILPDSLSGSALTISAVGLLDQTFYPVSNKSCAQNKPIKIYVAPSNRVLDEIIITPNQIADEVRKAYDRIADNYKLDPHILVGSYNENYKDTLSNQLLTIAANIAVAKPSYKERKLRGEIYVDSTVIQIYQSDSAPHVIIAGPHIPHRFDFVLRREEFINPKHFDKYQYTHLGYKEVHGIITQVIGFEPDAYKGQFAKFKSGKLYIDTATYAFVMGEYCYSKAGITLNTQSNWVRERRFTTTYSNSDSLWHLQSTWDMAFDKVSDFQLYQIFNCQNVLNDTTPNWTYEGRFDFNEAMIMTEADTVILHSTTQNKSSDLPTYLKQKPWKIGGDIGARLITPWSPSIIRISQPYTKEVEIPFASWGVTGGISLCYKNKYSLGLNAQLGWGENKASQLGYDISGKYTITVNTKVRPSNLNIGGGYSIYTSRIKMENETGHQLQLDNHALHLVWEYCVELHKNSQFFLRAYYILNISSQSAMVKDVNNWTGSYVEVPLDEFTMEINGNPNGMVDNIGYSTVDFGFKVFLDK